MPKGKVLLAGDSYTKSWDNYQFKSKAFTVYGRGLAPTTYAQKYVVDNGCIRSAQLFFEMCGYDATDVGKPGGSNSEAISAIEQNISEHDCVVVFLTSPSRDLEVRAYPEFKDFKLRTDDDIIWMNQVSNAYTYSRLKEIANEQQKYILCIGGLCPIDTDIFSQYSDNYLRQLMPWCLKFLAPDAKYNFKQRIRWGRLHDAGAIDANSLDIMPPVYTEEIDYDRHGLRGPREVIKGLRPDEDNWKSVEPWLFPDGIHLNFNAMWRIVDWAVVYMANNNIN